MTPFWAFAGIAYVILFIFNGILAWRLNVQLLRKYAVPSEKEIEEQHETIIQAMAAVTGRLENREISQQEAQLAVNSMKEGLLLLDIQNGLININNFIDEFEKTTRINRWVLCAAAASFVLAAIVSFTQAGIIPV
jgi:hypothetical protein